MENNLKVKKKSFMDDAIKFSMLSIFLGLLVGAIVLVISGNNPIEAYGEMIKGIIAKPKYIAWTIIKATPYILTGLSIAFAFKTGLFNIGAEGQFIIGALVATLVGYGIELPAIIHIPLTIILAAIAGGLWGAIAGFLKSKFGIMKL